MMGKEKIEEDFYPLLHINYRNRKTSLEYITTFSFQSHTIY